MLLALILSVLWGITSLYATYLYDVIGYEFDSSCFICHNPTTFNLYLAFSWIPWLLHE